MISSYPSIYALGHKCVKDIFTSPVVIQEKVDGAQISFGIHEGELHIRSRGAEIHEASPPKDFAFAVEAIKSVKSLLHPGWIYRGENLSKPKHNTLAYNRIPKNHIILFDVEVGLQDFLAVDVPKNANILMTLQSEAERLGFEAVPSLFVGNWDQTKGVEGFKELLERESVLGGPKIEGVVVKNYNLMGPDKKTLMAKFVSEAFKEIHSQAWKIANPGRGDLIELLISTFRTPARWQKAVQHLREAGLIEDAPKDIGLLIKEVAADVEKECRDEIREKLYAHFWPKIRRGITAGVAEWYKAELLKKQFETDAMERVPVGVSQDTSAETPGNVSLDTFFQ